MSNGTKTLLAIIVILILVWIGYAIVKSSPGEAPTTATSTEALKIGVILPLTGDAATYGEPGRNLFALALDEVNAAGGVNGQMLEFIYEDGKCNGPVAASAAQKLVAIDKVQIIIGGFCSSESLASIPVAESAKVAMFSPGSSSPDLTGRSMYFFRNYPSDASQGKILAEAAFNDKKWKTVAMLQEQTDFALGIRKVFETRFVELGGKIITEEFPSTASDFRSQLSKLRAAKPDALFLSLQTFAPTEKILKQLSDQKWAPNLLLSDVATSEELRTSRASQLEGALTAEFNTDPSNPKFSQMTSAYKAKYGVDVPYQGYAQTEYDAVYMVRDGLL
ncbi:MAG: hypothetical protein A2542_02540, partial [Parcubacteria group bacterium RIFOXYD2_FULL_52_8]